MKIATWNVNSIAARLPLVTRWIESSQPDVVCLQEIKCVDDRFPADVFEELGYRSAIHGQKTYNGVAILSREPIEDVTKGFRDDDETAQARVIAGTIDDIRVVNVYIPNGSSVGSEKYEFKLGWLGQLRAYLDDVFGDHEDIVLCGDFNVAPDDRDVHDPIAWHEKILCSTPERNAIDAIRSLGFVDLFRLHHEEPGLYSWWDYRSGGFRRNAGLRIDHIWGTGPTADFCTSTWIDKETRGWERPSDHAPVVTNIE